ncbi:MAG TPA: ATP-binding cassette domain-containing protein, partial [Chlamydiales bacterium]|nr:ATP-binding cassette domain-containing protein [Chlamydiales bacterium]
METELEKVEVQKNGLVVRDLMKKYGSRHVVNGLCINVSPGEIVGLLGPNGAGKTTAFSMIIGLTKACSGSIFFNGSDITLLPIHKRAKLGLGYLAQEPSVFWDLTVEENILAILETLITSSEEQQARLSTLL